MTNEKNVKNEPIDTKYVKAHRDELELKVESNIFPEPDEIDVRKLGLAGVRIKMNEFFGTTHGYNKKVFESLGITSEEIAQYSGEIIQIMKAILNDPSESRNNRRQFVVAFYGELMRKEGLQELKAVLDSPYESISTRGWAALTLGRVGGDEAINLLKPYLKHQSAILRRKSIQGLTLTKSKQSIDIIRQFSLTEKEPALVDHAINSLHKLEDIHSIKRTEFKKGLSKKKKRKQITTIEKQGIYY